MLTSDPKLLTLITFLRENRSMGAVALAKEVLSVAPEIPHPQFYRLFMAAFPDVPFHKLTLLVVGWDRRGGPFSDDELAKELEEWLPGTDNGAPRTPR